MRFVALSFLVACSEYDLHEVEDSSTVSSDPVAWTDEEPVTFGECGFLVDQPAPWQGVVTESLAVFSVAGDAVREVRRGEVLRYQFAIMALDCGDVELHLADLWVWDEEGHDWLTELNNSDTPMYLTNMTDGVVYEPYATQTMYVSTGGDELFYTWYDCQSGGSLNGACGNMDTIHVAAGTTKIIEFTFTGTQYAAVGDTFVVRLLQPVWTDVITDQVIHDWFGADGTEITVTVVE